MPAFVFIAPNSCLLASVNCICRISAAPSYIRRASFAPCLQIDHDTTNPARVWIAAEVRRGRRAGWNPHIFYFWPFFQRLRKSAMNTRAVTQENACARAREIFAPRFPKNFPKNFRVSFSRFVFSASRNLRYEHPHGSQRTCLARVLLA